MSILDLIQGDWILTADDTGGAYTANAFSVMGDSALTGKQESVARMHIDDGRVQFGDSLKTGRLCGEVRLLSSTSALYRVKQLSDTRLELAPLRFGDDASSTLSYIRPPTRVFNDDFAIHRIKIVRDVDNKSKSLQISFTFNVDGGRWGGCAVRELYRNSLTEPDLLLEAALLPRIGREVQRKARHIDWSQGDGSFKGERGSPHEDREATRILVVHSEGMSCFYGREFPPEVDLLYSYLMHVVRTTGFHKKLWRRASLDKTEHRGHRYTEGCHKRGILHGHRRFAHQFPAAGLFAG